MQQKIAPVVAAVLVAGAAHADDAALKAAKAAKREAALADARARAAAEAKKKAEQNALNARPHTQPSVTSSAADEAKKAEEEQHQAHLGVIERLEQIAQHTKDAALSAKVATLKQKEAERHALAGG